MAPSSREAGAPTPLVDVSRETSAVAAVIVRGSRGVHGFERPDVCWLEPFPGRAQVSLLNGYPYSLEAGSPSPVARGVGARTNREGRRAGVASGRELPGRGLDRDRGDRNREKEPRARGRGSISEAGPPRQTAGSSGRPGPRERARRRPHDARATGICPVRRANTRGTEEVRKRNWVNPARCAEEG